MIHHDGLLIIREFEYDVLVSLFELELLIRGNTVWTKTNTLGIVSTELLLLPSLSSFFSKCQG